MHRLHALPVGSTGTATASTSSSTMRRSAERNGTVSFANGVASPSSPAPPPPRPVPGRLRRKASTKRRYNDSIGRRLYRRWIQGVVTQFGSLLVAVLLWYGLGVVSIGSSKVLLSRYAIPASWLTLQQLCVGSTLLRWLMRIKFLGLTSGIQSLPLSTSQAGYSPTRQQHRRTSSAWITTTWQQFTHNPNLLWAALCFTGGFFATNVAFSGSSATFVETIKAAEPLTSAAVAVGYGIERLNQNETVSLLMIVAGVLLSTLGHHPDDGGRNDTFSARHHAAAAAAAAVVPAWHSCVVVMTANLCFSFRGLYQKLLRQQENKNAKMVPLDDLNLQFRMQQIGSAVLLLPTLAWGIPHLARAIPHTSLLGLLQGVALSLLNGGAFAAYNLASTYILTRISVVHHAALNCLRRIFAIYVTSILFHVTLTPLAILGMVLSVLGFLSFTHFKQQKKDQPKPLSSLLPVSASVVTSPNS